MWQLALLWLLGWLGWWLYMEAAATPTAPLPARAAMMLVAWPLVAADTAAALLGALLLSAAYRVRVRWRRRR